MNSKSKNIGLFNYRKYPTRMKLGKIDRVKMLENPKQKDVAFTPEEVVDDMLDLIPQYIWSDPNSTFIDPCCKSGIFLERIYWRLYEGLSEKIPDRVDRNNHILEKQLFGLSQYDKTADDSRSVLYGTTKANHKNAYTRLFDTEHGNILTLKIEDDKRAYYFEQIVGDETRNLVKEVMRKGFGEEMKFDVVIGNPPYNRGIDLDFVNLGFDLCKKYCVMITPAKWQTAEGDQKIASKTISYGEFREKLVPHMKKVVFYPDCKDVFDIYQIDGITYYIMDKNGTYNKCEVTNIGKARGDIYNGTKFRDIRHGDSLLNIGYEIISSMEPYKKFKFPHIQGNKRFVVMTNTQASGYDWFIEHGPRYLLGISRILDTKEGQTHKGAARVVFESDNREECESFVSWINTRFTRFLILPNISKLTLLDNHCFRFVPAPPSGKFDHIYTDEELYKAFNLPQKYIDVIEAVIKERK